MDFELSNNLAACLNTFPYNLRSQGIHTTSHSGHTALW